jgi:acylphosphatase
MKRVELVVRGIVQGVGFRYFCQKQAENIGITGTVQNMPDGTVRVEAQGDEAKLSDYIALVRQGPHNAFVTELKETPLELVGNEEELSVK